MKPHVETVGPDTPTIRTWCVVYDRETNEIVHTHEHIALDQDGCPDEEGLARAALAAVESVFDKKRVAVAHPAPGVELAPGLDYRVDAKSGSLLAQPAEEKTVRELRPRQRARR